MFFKCHRVCWGSPEGLSQRSHLFRRQDQRGFPLNANVERSTGISWGSCRAAERGHTACCCCRAATVAAAAAGSACTVYFGRTLNPAQPSRSLCAGCESTPPLFSSTDMDCSPNDRDQPGPSTPQHLLGGQTTQVLFAFCFFVWLQTSARASALWTSIQPRVQGGPARWCVYISSLAAPWIPVRPCQLWTTS